MGKVRGAAHRRMNIFLAFPTYDHKVDGEIMMMAAQLPPLYPQHQFQIDFIAGSILTGGRNYLVRNFLKSDSEWLLFWDSDVVIRDPSFLRKMLETAQNLKADVVGGPYLIKNDQNLYAFGNYHDGKLINFKVGELRQPMLVDTIVAGMMLINRKVLEKLKAPWFYIVDDKSGRTKTEDFNFCDDARKKGFKVAIDPRFDTYHFGLGCWKHKNPEN